MGRLHNAAYLRMQQVRAGNDYLQTGNLPDREAGYAMVLAMVIIMIITTAVSSMLIIVTSEIVPARDSISATSANAAAQAGVQAYLAKLNNSNPSVGCGTADQNNIACPAGVVDAIQGSFACIGAAGSACGTPNLGSDGSGKSYFWVQATNVNPPTFSSDRLIRLHSIGCSGPLTTPTLAGADPTCDGPKYVGRSLIADIKPQNVIVAYYSTYESVGSKLLAAQFPANRVITLATSGIVGAVSSILTPSQVKWNGASSNAATHNYCDSLYYDSDNNAIPKDGDGNRLGRANQGQNPIGYDWGEAGSVTKLGVPDPINPSPTHYAECQVAMTTNNRFTGPIVSQDAFYVSGTPYVYAGDPGTPGSAAAGGFPDVWTGWSGSSKPQVIAGQNPWHTTGNAGDTFTTDTSSASHLALTIRPGTVPAALQPNLYTQVPNRSGGQALANVCDYYGPTRVLLSYDTTTHKPMATITSPMTNALSSETNRPAGCYTNLNGATVALAGQPATVYDPNKKVGDLGFAGPGSGVAGAQVQLNAGTQPVTIIVHDVVGSKPISPGNMPPATWPQTTGDSRKLSDGTLITPIFDISSGTAPSTAVDSITHEAAKAVSTNNSQFATDVSAVNAVLPAKLPGVINLPTFEQDLTRKLSTFSTNVANTAAQSATNLTAMNAEVAKITNVVGSPVNGNWRYSPLATGGSAVGCAPPPGTNAECTVDGPLSNVLSDSLLTKKADGTSTGHQSHSGSYLAQLQYQSKRQVYQCQFFNPSGPSSCFYGPMLWMDDLSNTTLTVTDNKFTGATTTTNYTVGTPPESVFPINNSVSATPDRTVYNTFNPTGSDAPGDIYVEGTLGNPNDPSFGLIAENDVVVTNSITPYDSTTYTPPITALPGATEPGAAIVAGGNVRLYHPVTCVSAVSNDLTNTTAGFCPNDTTGLFYWTPTGGLIAPTGSNRPAAQYTNLPTHSNSPDACTSDIAIDGSIFSTGSNAADKLPTDNGSFTTDNADKGSAPCGSVYVNGAVYQQHRGSIGAILEDGSTTGYNLQYNYDSKLTTKLTYNWKPTSGSTTAAWSVAATSTAPAGP